MSLVVLEPGLASRIVDAGRPRTRSLGVPVGGAADQRSLAIGNSLLGNDPNAAALEITLTGPRLCADADAGCVVFGAPFEIRRAGYRVPIGHTFTLHAGDELSIGGIRVGTRAYLCVVGGFHAPAILASRSALEPIQSGEVLVCTTSAIGTRFCPELAWSLAELCSVSVLPGLQASWFDETEFYDQTFTVTPQCNRMGSRLQGNALSMPKRELVSEPVCPGAIQITPDGQSIVLGVDGQTIGGYPKIAQVIQADLDLLGQLRPGQRLHFVKIDMNETIRRDREARAELRAWTLRLRLSLDSFPADRKFASS